jgi:glyoxalase superfamily protein
MSGPFWLSAFLDFPPDRYDAGVAFWADVTGFATSVPRGPREEFATLVPPDGDAYLRVQRVGDGRPRLHLDVHVDDVRATADQVTGDGARLVADEGDYVTLASPGGLTFCLVTHPGGARPAPRAWPDGHLSGVDQVCLDVPPSAFAAELDFWHRLTGWGRRDPAPGSEFARLTPQGDLPLQLLVQRLDDEQDAVTAHLDWAATDHEAELAAHVAAGAEPLARHDEWTVLADPTGLRYCVTRRAPAPRNA